MYFIVQYQSTTYYSIIVGWLGPINIPIISAAVFSIWQWMFHNCRLNLCLTNFLQVKSSMMSNLLGVYMPPTIGILGQLLGKSWCQLFPSYHCFIVRKSQFIDVSKFNPQFLSDRIYLRVKYHCLLVVTTHLPHIIPYSWISISTPLISQSLSDK